MEFKTIGTLIKEIRTAKKITRKDLSYGICSEHTLQELESNCYAADVLMLDILLQRLGQSPDKFEIVLSSNLYNMVRLRDLISEATCRGNRELAKLLLQNYPVRTHVDEMYQHRMKAFWVYHMDGNCALAAEYLLKSASLTLPDYPDDDFYEQMGNYLISAIELENILALERMNIEKNAMDSTVRELSKHHLVLCMDYIENHFSGDEEYAKLISKCTWLLGGICYLEQDYMQTILFCQKGIEALRKNTILYFMLPLLKLLVKSEAALGIAPERSKWVQYYDILTFLWDGYAKKWYPTDSLLHNCYQRDYHLDFELVRAERKSQNMTQAQLAEDIYRNPESLSRMETGAVSPNKKTFEKLMDKLGLKKRMYNGFVVTNSFEVMELRRTIDGFIMRREYQKAKEATQQLKDSLDMEIPENRMIISLCEIVAAQSLGELSLNEALEKLEKLSARFMNLKEKTFSHIPMRNEVLVINNICITLRKLGNVTEAIELYRSALDKIRSSKVKIKYRYRSYQLLFNNYIRENGSMEDALKELQYEFLCGKASELPFCLNNILQRLSKNDVHEDECYEWAKAIYYMCNLYYFEKDKKVYKDFLQKKKNIKVID